MKEDNKKFINPSLFNERVLKVLKCKNITLDELYILLTEKAKYEISKNNVALYIQRTPNINFLIALCKALDVSADYLLGLEDIDMFSAGFDYKYDDKRYRKYECEDYFFFFYPTVSNSPSKMNVAKLSIYKDTSYKAELRIETDEGELKRYVGDFILSSNYDIGFITLKGVDLGEIVHLSFHDPIINGETKTELLVGAMLSVSTGDFKRAPVMSRFIISRHEIKEENLTAIKANLTLNSKYILIDSEKFLEAFNSFDLEETKKKNLLSRLTNAFQKNEYYRFEEGYILNTIAKDFKLSSKETTTLINILRVNSISNANCKINHKIDSRLFDYFYLQ